MDDINKLGAVVVNHEPQHDEHGSDNPQWHAWRKTSWDDGPRITATMASVIMGTSPYQTAYGLWQQFVGEVPTVSRVAAPEFVLKRGLQSEADAMIAFAQSLATQPTVQQYAPFDHKELSGPLVCRVGAPWVSASLDACFLDPLNGAPLFNGEFKLNGKEAHGQLITTGSPVRHHICQIQWQMLAANVTETLYVSTPFSGDGARVILRMEADPELQQQMLARVIAFRQAVVDRSPPQVNGEEAPVIIRSCAQSYLRACGREEDAKAERSAMEATLEAALIAHGCATGFEGCGISYKSVKRSGAVQWAKLVKALSVEIDPVTLAKFTGKASDTMKLEASSDADGFLASLDVQRKTTPTPEAAKSGADW